MVSKPFILQELRRRGITLPENELNAFLYLFDIPSNGRDRRLYLERVETMYSPNNLYELIKLKNRIRDASRSASSRVGIGIY